MKLILSIILIAAFELCVAQTITGEGKPELDKPIPKFTLTDVHYYKNRVLRPSDFEGRWLVLNFWVPSCGTCIGYLDKANRFQEKFKKDMAFVMIGLNRGINENIRDAYEQLRKKKNLNLISAYDTALANAWNIGPVPHVVIVDPKGIVTAITLESSLTEQKILDLLSGKKVAFADKEKKSPQYDITTFPGSANGKIVYRSILTQADNEQSAAISFSSFVQYPSEYRKHGFFMANVSLADLYMRAYTGGDLAHALHANPVFFPRPVLAMKDSSLFNADEEAGGYKFNYNLSLPEEKSKDIREITKTFQQELKNVFGFKVEVVEREMTVMALTRLENPKVDISASGGKFYFEGGPTFGAMGFTIDNCEIDAFVDYLDDYVARSGRIMVDETNITGKIKLKVDADMTNLADVKRALNKQGLDLVTKKRRVNVVIIRDEEGI